MSDRRSAVQVLRHSSRADRRALWEAATELSKAAVAVRFMPFGRTARRRGFTVGAVSAAPDPAVQLAAAEVVVALKRVAGRTPWTSTCLMQSLAGEAMLRRRAIPATVYLGVAKSGERFDAHSWLVCGDRVLTGGAEMNRFSTLTSYAATAGPASRLP